MQIYSDESSPIGDGLHRLSSRGGVHGDLSGRYNVGTKRAARVLQWNKAKVRIQIFAPGPLP